MAAERIAIDLAKSAARMEQDIETLRGSDYTSSNEAIRRYAYIPEFLNTLAYFTRELEAIGFDVWKDPVGNLIARNRPKGEPAFGVGSHCDSNRNGGAYDGTLGVVTALEVCRLSSELGLDLPLQLISFLEEESSGFGIGVLGSRIMTHQVTEEDLRENFRAHDDGRTFWEHATDAGLEPERWRECREALADLVGWVELHIEQGRGAARQPGAVRHRHSDRWHHLGRPHLPRPRRSCRRHADGLPGRRQPGGRRDRGRAREACERTADADGRHRRRWRVRARHAQRDPRRGPPRARRPQRRDVGLPRGRHGHHCVRPDGRSGTRAHARGRDAGT